MTDRPYGCPIVPDSEDLRMAMHDSRKTWDRIWLAFGVLMLTTIFWAGYNLAALRGELTLGSHERASIVASTTKLAEIVDRLDQRLQTVEQSVSRLDGQRDGWRSARERARGEE